MPKIKTKLIATSSIIMKAVAEQVSLSHTRSTCRKLGVDVTYRCTNKEARVKLRTGRSFKHNRVRQ